MAANNSSRIPQSTNGAYHTDVEVAAPVSSAPSCQVVMPEHPAEEEDLFVLPMSPRSPEMRRSPFSLL